MAETTTAPPSGTAEGGSDQGGQGGKAQEVAGQAQEKAQELAGQAQEKVQEASGQARDRVRSEVDQRSTQAGERISSTAEDVRSVGEELRKQGKDGPAKIADQAAERAQRVGGYLKDSDADRILSDVEDFGRKRPWAVVAGGLVAGFAASRFLKASSSQRYAQSSGRAPAFPNGGQPSGNGARTDREIGGPVASPEAPTATGGATGTRPTGLDPHS